MHNQKIKKFLKQFGLNEEEIVVLLYLNDFEKLTVLNLSRGLGMERTKVYRILERLKLRGLVDESIEENSHLVFVVDSHVIELNLLSRESKFKELKQSFSEVSTYFDRSRAPKESKAKVHYYQGENGIKQMLWNTLKSETELLTFTNSTTIRILENEYNKRWKNECDLRKIHCRYIHSNDYLEGIKLILDSREYFPLEQYWQGKYVSPEQYSIKSQVAIYNDTVAVYDWVDNDLYGMEIIDKNYAGMQRQLFQIVWDLGTKQSLNEVISGKIPSKF